MRQLPLALGEPPEPTFSSYLGQGNAQAVACLAHSGSAGAPVYLWGPRGVGKTHLLRASLQHRQERRWRPARGRQQRS